MAREEFTVEERVYEDDEATGGRRLKYPAGAVISREEAEAAGLVKKTRSRSGTSDDNVSDKARTSRSATKKTAAPKDATSVDDNKE